MLLIASTMALFYFSVSVSRDSETACTVPEHLCLSCWDNKMFSSRKPCYTRMLIIAIMLLSPSQFQQNFCTSCFALSRSQHNYLRITRILKSLGELGYEAFKAPLVRLFLEESLCKNTIPNMQHSVLEYYVYTIRLPATRRRLLRYARQHYRPAHAFLWGPPPKRRGGGVGGGGGAGSSGIRAPAPTPEQHRRGMHGELLILLSFTHREWVLGCCAPTPRDKEMKFIGEGVYSRQCRVRISSCYSSKHNNFMLTKTSPLPLIKPLTRSGKAHACYLHDCFDQRHSSGLYPYEMFFSLRLKSSWHCQLNKYYGLSK